ncbi:unnamed protein product [Euphydryas editha]|uniref:Uncharacterized protein n=1 Tax=Euphydryas editha TaxID=104508 RepID=A0AAU9TZY0_EUPED|nr:unnamed protein product [Euphydryas editha]
MSLKVKLHSKQLQEITEHECPLHDARLFKRMAPVSKLSCRNFKLDESLKCKWFSFIPHPLGQATPVYCAPRGDWHTNTHAHMLEAYVANHQWSEIPMLTYVIRKLSSFA